MIWYVRVGRFKAPACAAQRALACRDWTAFDDQLALARKAAESIRNRYVRSTPRVTWAFLRHRAPTGAVNSMKRAGSSVLRSSIWSARAHQTAQSRSPWRTISGRCVLRPRGELGQAEKQFQTAAQIIEFARNPGMAIFSLQRLTLWAQRGAQVSRLGPFSRVSAARPLPGSVWTVHVPNLAREP
jgi:hypothetical protein